MVILRLENLLSRPVVFPSPAYRRVTRSDHDGLGRVRTLGRLTPRRSRVRRAVLHWTADVRGTVNKAGALLEGIAVVAKDQAGIVTFTVSGSDGTYQLVRFARSSAEGLASGIDDGRGLPRLGRRVPWASCRGLVTALPPTPRRRTRKRH